MKKTFVLTSDCDHLLGDEHIKVLRLFADSGIFMTTALFATVVNADGWLGKHCHPGDTDGWLDDPVFRKGLIEAQSMGHEIAFHGTSQISNTREEFMRGIDSYNETFGDYPVTYIEHGPNPKTHIGFDHKKELLDANNSQSSPYYIADIVKDVFKICWTQEYLVDELNLPVSDDQWFCHHGGLNFVKRCRMAGFPSALKAFKDFSGGSTSFVGYTHLGYTGYYGPKRSLYLRLFRNMCRNRFEHWVGDHGKRNIIELISMSQEYGVKISTLKDFYFEQEKLKLLKV